MCGLVGIASSIGHRPALNAAGLLFLRDCLAHRGPDGAGLWDGGHVLLAHRRLAVIDLSAAAAQPFHSRDESGVMVYNGELYNEPELRSGLANAWPLRTSSDTEVLIESLVRDGLAAIGRLRGMFAFAFVDRRAQTLTLARDPLGIKPLYWTRLASTDGASEVAFASEASVLAEMRRRSSTNTLKPDLVAISGYLTTIRSTLDDRTLFQDIQIVRPGEVLTFDLRTPSLAMQRTRIDVDGVMNHLGETWADPTQAVRHAVQDSLRRHLRSDVPVCCLLSGGLDSSITAMLAAGHVKELRTYCAGAVASKDAASDGTRTEADFEFARRMAGTLRVVHTDVVIDQPAFDQNWPEMVERLGVPLSTPNEVAIRAVSKRLRADGFVVAVSGEGADELFAGYDLPLRAVMKVIEERGRRSVDASTLANVLLASASWIPVERKAHVMSNQAWREAQHDAALTSFVERALSTAGTDVRDLDTHGALAMSQRWIRRVNLEGLLLRLDTAMMLEGVEGRTPFADVAVAALAESLPMTARFDPTADDDLPSTKRVLRRAFASDLPPDVLRRPKASFPLPFQGWMAGSAQVLTRSAWLGDTIRPEVLRQVEADPASHWTLAWPLINLGLWAERWWD